MLKYHLEELSLNHWPSLSTLMTDGWMLRLANGYTKRANSISPIFGSTVDVEEKIKTCEQFYTACGQRTIFKITPFVKPADLDQLLEGQDYRVEDVTQVQTMTLDALRRPYWTAYTIQEQLTEEWLEALIRINEVKEQHRATMISMLNGIILAKGFISLYHEDKVVACGLGVCERGYIGLYDIVTDPKYRNQGLAEQMILHLLHWGKARGAEASYLAVIDHNKPALRLYEKLGYEHSYNYWYRVKEIGSNR
ncbi:GNAT family N-acetyltransferase [Paenibacillus sp. JX-17]|uniref:GNAT family N-acetyltransferase n=1 Tax=Paenibacillus lacisoli TaxID=3064525 RepID=A0ABT9CM18_9BACL|nr:GNAT family N-acetyltransferase [Paenibacillus sp. JX-17]MDO7908653.1 GNAT family N-acetyltransferase [Paenibacillus sp. JX-17]